MGKRQTKQPSVPSRKPRTLFLKRMKSLDTKFLDGKLTQSLYDTKRVKLTRQYSDSLKRR